MADVLPYDPPFSEAEAATRLGVSLATMQRIRKRGEIRFMMIGGRPRYRQAFINEYLAAQEVPPCPRENPTPARSETTGRPAALAARNGAGRGSTPTLDRRAEHHSALTILQRPASSSPHGSPSTSPASMRMLATPPSPASSSGISRNTVATPLVPTPKGAV